MDVKNLVLSYYKNATTDFHITRITTPQEALRPHRHPYFQVYYVVRGSLIHHIADSLATLKAGDVFILPPDLPHHIEAPGKDVDFYSMSFTPDYLQSTKESNKLVLDLLYYLRTEATEHIQPKLTLSYEDMTLIELLLGRITEEFSGHQAGKNEIIKECVSVILSVFARMYFSENAHALKTEQSKQSVMHCIGYIKNHFDEELTLSEMVRLSAMSKTSFCALFTAITGTSFKDYLNRCRIEKAMAYLQEGEKVSYAGFRCGYNDLSTFYRNFKKYKGISPNAYAAEHTKTESKPAVK